MTRGRLFDLAVWTFLAISAVMFLFAVCGHQDTEQAFTLDTTATAAEERHTATSVAYDADAYTVQVSTTRVPVTRASRKAPAPRTPDGRGAGATTNVASYELLDALAQCESGMYAGAISPTGRYLGAFQMLLSTWHSLGEEGNPVQYSYEYQREVARRIPVSAWGRQFPACSRRLGVA